MLNQFIADLHIHTCLSPCAELEMSPLSITQSSIEKGLNIIAITDHNSAENVAASIKTAHNTDLTVLAGMEITTSEEAHILALFNDVESVMKVQDIIYSNLMPGENDEKLFGEQIVVNENDEVIEFNKRMLIGATTLTAEEIIETIHSFKGLCVASHIDKEVFSIVSQLGFIPDNINFDALEISPNTARNEAEQSLQPYSSYTWISSSDAHHPEDIGRRTTTFHIKEPTVEEMAKAFKNIDGRKVEWK